MTNSWLNQLPTGLNTASFLAEYWQKKPLLLRGAFADFKSPLSAEELAGMACEDGIESRLIVEHAADCSWQLRHGPFEPNVFAELPASHWTLLVQDADKYVPELAQLLDNFRFIPNWRVDDLMVSYAPVNGSAGPHIDHYDVFLLQAHGHKRWQIACEPRSSELLVDSELGILANFVAEQSWELAPGDMLYLPPGVAHYGVALDDNLTFSVGFRAPTERDLITGYVEAVASEHALGNYCDPELSAQAHPGEIDAHALARVRQIVEQISVDDAALAEWFGCFITEPKHIDELEPPIEQLTPEELVGRFKRGEQLLRSPFTRLACIERSDAMWLFVAGELETYKPDLRTAIFRLCDERTHAISDWRGLIDQRRVQELLCRLTNQGHLYFECDPD